MVPILVAVSGGAAESDAGRTTEDAMVRKDSVLSGDTSRTSSSGSSTNRTVGNLQPFRMSNSDA